MEAKIFRKVTKGAVMRYLVFSFLLFSGLSAEEQKLDHIWNQKKSEIRYRVDVVEDCIGDIICLVEGMEMCDDTEHKAIYAKTINFELNRMRYWLGTAPFDFGDDE